MENLPAIQTPVTSIADIPTLSSEQLRKTVGIVQQAMKDVMKQDVHYGVIPGTQKPTLYKQGAEKLCLLFRLQSEFKIEKTELQDGHREYSVICTLKSGSTVIAQGVGSCSTLESKYRYRAGQIDTGRKPPQEYYQAKGDWKRQQEILGKGLRVKKNDAGDWTIHKVGEGKVDNPDIADLWNTVLKMAKKRAHIDAVLTATGASDCFDQDLEDYEDVMTADETPAAPEPKPEPAELILYDFSLEPHLEDSVLEKFKLRFGGQFLKDRIYAFPKKIGAALNKPDLDKNYIIGSEENKEQSKSEEKENDEDPKMPNI